MCWASNPPPSIKDLIIGSVEEFGERGQVHGYSFGRLDILRAIDFATVRDYVPTPKGT